MGGMFTAKQESKPAPPAYARTIGQQVGSLFPGGRTGDLESNPLIQAYRSYLSPSQAERDLPGTLSQYAGPIGSYLSEQAMAGLDTDAILGPLQRAFTQTVAPEIRSSALRAGAPGGSVEGDLFSRASGEFGAQGAEALSRAELARRSVAGQIGPLGASLQTMGPEAAARLGAQEQQYGRESALSPLQIAMQAIQGLLPFFGQKSTSTPSPWDNWSGVFNQAAGTGTQGLTLAGMSGAGPLAALLGP